MENVEQEFLSVIREYERVIYKVAFISFYMVYSKRVTDLQQIYQLTPDDVFFLSLIHI